LPTLSEEILKLATPDPTSVFVPNTVLPSRNVTTPVGAPTEPAAATTFAVNVTLCPLRAGSTLEVSIVTVWALAGVVAGNTVTVTGAEVEPRCVVSPEKTAVSTCVPTAKFAPALAGQLADGATGIVQIFAVPS
jgi:hypothetical protein